ncbi:MAG: hypothetical protein K6V97_09925 [Actinomycetia bacterium]|nr:hypothetical protein [Actinomycetes bacterium]
MTIRRRFGLAPGWIGIATGALLLWHVALHTGLDGDVFWQWAAGRWMLAHHRLLTQDVFSYTVSGRPWFTEEWGYEVLLAGLIQLLGPVALWLLSAGVGSAAVVVSAVAARAQGASWTWAGLLAVLLGLGLELFLRDRPQVVSYLLFAAQLALLARARKHPRTLCILPGLMALWANLHGSFLLGLGVLALEAVAAWWPVRWGRWIVSRPLERRAATAVLGAGGLATFLTPHGPALWGYAWHVATDSRIAAVIQEWQSPNFHDPLLLALVAGPIAWSVVALGRTSEPVSWPGMVLSGTLLVATLDSVRFLPYFLLAWVHWAASRPLAPDLNRARPALWVWPAVVVVAVLFLRGPWVAPGTPARTVPVAAVDRLRNVHGRIFATYRWGDYLVWAGVPVFIDGRTDLYTGTGVLGEYLGIANLTRVPDAVWRDYGVDYVLWPPGTTLAVYLERDPGWRLVYVSAQADIFERVTARTTRGGV